MKKRILFIAAGSIIISAAVVVLSQSSRIVKELLTGFEEVPAISTGADGTFRARVSDSGTSVEYELTYADLEGDVTQAHIHLGQKDVNGGIAVFLCSNLGNGPEGTQACPPPPATITGTFGPDDVIGPVAQGISPGEFDELLRAARAGKTYVNVHSTLHPGGEIRSQINPGDNHGKH